ncbi:capsid staple protein [Burkholderia gladioli]|uniref:capsid staple protein n=1 Tax=Burkholderia gladioli TaxID=28095 RepID=UPI003D25623C
MISMKLTPAEAKQEAGTAPMDAEQPAYPYGLTICLDDEALAKLGITSLPDVGTPFTLTARVEVCSTSQYQNQDGADRNLSLQITDMELGPPPSTQTPEERASKFYGSSTQ